MNSLNIYCALVQKNTQVDKAYIRHISVYSDIYVTPNAVVESVEHRAPVRKIRNSFPAQIKPITYEIGTFQAFCIIRIMHGLVALESG